MRVLSARVLRARRMATSGRVEAIVTLIVEVGDRGQILCADIPVSAPRSAPMAPPLRARLIAAAKLAFATRTQEVRESSRAA
jgi:hypothetical protein